MAEFFGTPVSDFLEGTNENDTFRDFLGGEDFIFGREGFDTLDARVGFDPNVIVDFQLVGGQSTFFIITPPLNPGDPELPPEISFFEGIERIITPEFTLSNFFVNNGFFNNNEDPLAAPNRDIVIVISLGSANINFDADFITGTVDLTLAQTGVDLNMLNGFLTGGLNGSVVNARTVIGSNFGDTVSASTASVLIEAGTGNDLIRGNAGIDTYDGGDGTDTVDYVNHNASGGMTINLITQQATTVATGELDQFISIENASGSNLRDTIFAGLNGSVISGRGGDDLITGSQQSDTLNGDAGEDFILSIGGLDVIDGGADFDTVSFQALGSGSRFTITNGQWLREDPHGGVQSRVQNVESVVGTQGVDIFTVAGDFTSNGDRFINIRGGQGNDQIQALGALGDVTIRADYRDAQAGVIADLGDEFARSALPNDAANIGFDTLLQVTQVRGSQFGDQLFGSNNDVFESFRGESGNDFIDGRGGQDRIDYRNTPTGVTVDMALQLTTDDGFGFIDFFQNIEEVRGSTFADTLSGDASSNAFQPRGGNDVIDGRGGFDTVDYRFEVTNGIGLQINLGATSTIQGKSEGGNAAVGLDTLVSIEKVNGSRFADTYVADSDFRGSFDAFNVFEGLAGDDSVTGNNLTRVEYDRDATAGIFADLGVGIIRGDASVGRDTVSGIFEVSGTRFDDRIFGSNNNPVLGDGDEAFESFEGLAGNDLIVGRDGSDRANYSRSDAGVDVNLALGIAQDGFGTTDTLFGIEGIKGSRFADILTGDAGNNFFEPLGGADVVNGGEGEDDLVYDDLTTGIDIDLRQDRAVHENGDVVTVLNIENATGGSGGDDIIGDGFANKLDGEDGDDRLVGLAGNDDITGGAGRDLIFGNSGDDTLEGEDGDDRLIGGFGADKLIGGRGNDSYVVDNIDDDIDELANGGADIDSVFASVSFTLDVAVENLSLIGGNAIDGTGNGIDNAITGNDADNTLRGGGGDDTLQGGGGADMLLGQGGGDLLVGDDGDDMLLGQDGQDELDGGLGNDTLVGGATVGESDIFKFRPGDGIDTIQDFELDIDFLDMTAFLFGDGSEASSFFSRIGENVKFVFNETTEITLIGVTDTPFDEIII